MQSPRCPSPVIPASIQEEEQAELDVAPRLPSDVGGSRIPVPCRSHSNSSTSTSSSTSDGSVLPARPPESSPRPLAAAAADEPRLESKHTLQKQVHVVHHKALLARLREVAADAGAAQIAGARSPSLLDDHHHPVAGVLPDQSQQHSKPWHKRLLQSLLGATSCTALSAGSSRRHSSSAGGADANGGRCSNAQTAVKAGPHRATSPDQPRHGAAASTISRCSSPDSPPPPSSGRGSRASASSPTGMERSLPDQAATRGAAGAVSAEAAVSYLAAWAAPCPALISVQLQPAVPPPREFAEPPAARSPTPPGLRASGSSTSDRLTSPRSALLSLAAGAAGAASAAAGSGSGKAGDACGLTADDCHGVLREGWQVLQQIADRRRRQLVPAGGCSQPSPSRTAATGRSLSSTEAASQARASTAMTTEALPATSSCEAVGWQQADLQLVYQRALQLHKQHQGLQHKREQGWAA